jgi:uncharacterized membrane protein
VFFSFLTLTLACALTLIIGSVIAGSMGRSLRPGERAPTKEEMRTHLVWGLVYSNPDDPRGWVPKIRGVGWTVNFASRGFALIMAQVTILTIAAVIGTVVTAMTTFVLPVVGGGRPGTPLR